MSISVSLCRLVMTTWSINPFMKIRQNGRGGAIFEKPHLCDGDACDRSNRAREK